MAKKKLTPAKARKILHDKEVHGHPLTEKQRKFFGAIAGGAKPYKAQVGTMLTAFPSNWGDRLSDVLSFPQKAITKLFTGEYQTPSEAMKIENPLGALATDMLLDPINLLSGTGAAKATKSLIGWKPNPGAYYRMLGKEGLADAIESGVVRANPKRGMFDVPFFSKGEPWDKKYSGPYMAEYLADDVVFPKEELFDVATPRKSISIDNPNLKFYKKDWLRGYKQVKPSKKKQDGGWLDKYEAPQAQNGIEGTMGGLTDVGFNYNGAWGGTMQTGGNLMPAMAGANQTVPMAQLGDSVKPIPMQLAMGGSLPGAVGFTYARTAGAAPANGPYAKKTKASAQDGEKVMKGREYVEQWMNSPMYKQMLEKSAQGPEFERINTGRISNLSIPTNVSTDISLHGTGTLGQKQHRVRTMFNATVPEREEMIKILQAAVDNPKDKEAKRKADQIMQPVVTGWNIGMNPVLKPGTLDYEATLAHEYGHTTDDPFVSKLPHQMSKKELMSQDLLPYIPKSDIEKMQSYYQGKVNDDFSKYLAKPQETRQFLTSLRYLGKTQGVYDPFTEKITPEQYKRIKPTELSDPAGMLRNIYTDEQIIDMLNSISKRQNVSDRVPIAQNGQEMKFYQEGLDFTPKTISKNGGWLDKYDAPQAQDGDVLEYLKKNKTAPVVTKGKPLTANQQKRITAETLKRQAQRSKPLTATNTREQAVERGRAENLRVIEENKEYDRQAIAEGKAAEATRENPNVPFTFPTGETKLWKDMDWRERQYVSGRNLGSMSRSNNWTDWINPVTMIGEMGEGLATAPYMARETDSNLPYIAGIVSPLLGGALGGRGTKSVGQFANSMLNPLAGIGSSSGAPAKGSIMSTLKGLKVNDNIKFDFTDRLNTGVESYTQGLASGAIELGLSPLAKLKGKSTRSFGEIFPRTAQEKFIAKQQSEKASSVGEQFVKDWTYDESGWVRPEIAKKINAITSSGASPSPYAAFLDNYTVFDVGNPLSYTPNIMTSTRYRNVVNNRNLSDLDKIRILSNRADATGVNYAGDFPASFTFENMGPYEYSYPQKLSTAVHEGAHTMQELGFQNYGFGESLAYFDPEYKYYVPNTATEIGRKFAEVMPAPRKGKSNWRTSPNEMHSELMAARQKLVDKYTKSGTGYQDALATVRNATDKDLDWMIDRQRLNRFFKKDVPQEKKREMLRLLPAAVPAVGAASMLGGEGEPKKQQDGGDIPVDPMGYWNPENVGGPVIIPSTDITMEGVDQPLIGISDTGDVQYMEPGKDYEFEGDYVTEYPVAKKGVSVNNADAQPLKKLDQLLNFTNYNKPTKGGWLDKYN